MFLCFSNCWDEKYLKSPKMRVTSEFFWVREARLKNSSCRIFNNALFGNTFTHSAMTRKCQSKRSLCRNYPHIPVKPSMCARGQLLASRRPAGMFSVAYLFLVISKFAKIPQSFLSTSVLNVSDTFKILNIFKLFSY